MEISKIIGISLACIVALSFTFMIIYLAIKYINYQFKDDYSRTLYDRDQEIQYLRKCIDMIDKEMYYRELLNTNGTTNKETKNKKIPPNKR